jgi:hypothetical protein
MVIRAAHFKEAGLAEIALSSPNKKSQLLTA